MPPHPTTPLAPRPTSLNELCDQPVSTASDFAAWLQKAEVSVAGLDELILTDSGSRLAMNTHNFGELARFALRLRSLAATHAPDAAALCHRPGHESHPDKVELLLSIRRIAEENTRRMGMSVGAPPMLSPPPIPEPPTEGKDERAELNAISDLEETIGVADVRVGGVVVPFKTDGYQRKLLLALWDAVAGRPKPARREEDVMNDVYDHDHDHEEKYGAFRQLKSDLRRRLETANCPYIVQAAGVMVALKRLTNA